LTSKFWTCERCGAGAEICHHKIWLTPTNIINPDIAFGWDNLESMCRHCHELEHEVWRGKKNARDSGGIGSELLSVTDGGMVRGEDASIDDIIDRLIL
jgi:hypothetical protein